MNPKQARRRRSRAARVEALEGRALLATAAAGREVNSLYETLLERAPTAADLSYWGGQLDGGVNPATVYKAFVNSAERRGLVAAGRATGTPLSTVNADAFDALFARDVAAANAVNNVYAGSLGGAADVKTFVDDLYSTVLGRAPGAADESFWVGRLEAGASLNSVAGAFLNSPEYFKDVAAGTAPFVLKAGPGGDTSQAVAFIDSLYTGILNRSADPQGAASWLTAVEAGASPDTLVTDFLTSPELLRNIAGGVAGTGLSNNLSAPSGGTETATGTTELASSFTTGPSGDTLNGVTLLLSGTAGGSARVEIFSDAGLQPGALVATMTSPSGYATTLTPTTFTSGGITLKANATYWVVLVADGGSFQWSWASADTGTGAGFQDAWASSADAGATWFYHDAYPTQMSVTAFTG